MNRPFFVTFITIFALFCATITSAEPQRQNDSTDLNEDQKGQIFGGIVAYSDMVDQISLYLESPQISSPPNQCPSKYQTSPDESLRIFIGLGYQNGERSITEDIIAANALREMITRPCKNELLEICGFKPPLGSQSESLYKKIVFTRSGALNLLKEITIEIETSSFTVYDYDNQNKFRKQQEEKSRDAKEKYLSALSSHDVVFYVGHSRDGGGPDFNPPKLLAKYQNELMVVGDKVDYGYYKKNPVGIQSMINALSSNSNRPRTIGVFSCNSSGHFSKELDKVLDSSTLLLLSSKVTEHSFEAMLVGLNGVLSNQCPNELEEALKRYDGMTREPK